VCVCMCVSDLVVEVVVQVVAQQQVEQRLLAHVVVAHHGRTVSRHQGAAGNKGPVGWEGGWAGDNTTGAGGE